MEIKNKIFLVYGMGISGISAYKFLVNKGANAFLYADKKAENCDHNLKIVKSFSEVLNNKIDYVVVSPGVQIIGNKNLNKLKKMGALLISELELGYLFCKGKFIAVTGTNGKTTCVSALNHVLSKQYKTFLCGNVGVPITSICEETDENSVVVCEVSSFMLELTSPNFVPDIAVITNITPDHISRHKTFDNYCKTKLKITENQTEDNYLLIPEELKDIQTNAKKILVNSKNKIKSQLIGEFNLKNLNFCQKVCEILNISKKQFQKEIKSFTPVKFRLQCLGKKQGVTYINDSKSTNPDSTVQALNAMNKKAVVLLGGSNKGNSFTEIFKLSNKIKLAIIYGETANIIEGDALFMGFTKTSKFINLKEVLYHLNQLTSRGDIVLFSPACASYDEFNNYIERGECFNKFYEEQ